MTEHQIDPKYGVPILGTAPSTGPNAPGLTANMEILDSEVEKMRIIVTAIENKYGERANYFDMEQEIKDRFRKIGFIVAVGWWMMEHADSGKPVEGLLMPEITIRDRTEGGYEFDHDRQVHEVTNDLLNLGTKGVIKSDPSQFQSHGHSH